MMEVKRVYHHLNKWECLKFGMYDDADRLGRSADECKKLYALFLSDLPRFEGAIKKVFSEWPLSCEHFLTNPNHNRIAWIGQSSMCIDSKVPCKFRAGFMLLCVKQREEANKVARIHLAEWLKERKIYESAQKNKGIFSQLEMPGL